MSLHVCVSLRAGCRDEAWELPKFWSNYSNSDWRSGSKETGAAGREAEPRAERAGKAGALVHLLQLCSPGHGASLNLSSVLWKRLLLG